ncbi:hypothetical protein H0H93_003536 [Arthromyces matolae]|nr:hypothetical protein H0H93_003536 [Arthromyces matolae]
MLHRHYLLYSLFVTAPQAVYVTCQQISAAQIAAQYGLTTSTTLPYPSATQPSTDTDTYLVQDWSLGKGRIQDNPDNLAFVNDPFSSSSSTTNSTTPALQVTYPANEFGSTDSGAQFINLWNATDGSSFQSMLLSYEVAFDSGFDWVKGGKLPGLRGGLNSTGCSGGNQSNGKDCFSTRLMWRQNGQGEGGLLHFTVWLSSYQAISVYAYIPTPNKLCSSDGIICNSDFGISIQRGSFGFVSGQWNRITLLVRLNDPPNVANGNVQLYFNDLKAIDQQNLQIRSSSSVDANGLYFSTFYGGSDSSWEPSETTHTYFRNIQLYGGSAASNLTGSVVSAADRSLPLQLAPLLSIAAIYTAVLLF